LEGVSAGEASVSLFPEQGAWIGAMVPKRWAKRAVTRNAIKRQIYAVSAELTTQFAEKAHVVRLRSAFSRSEFPSASSEVLKREVRIELIKLFGRDRMQVPSKPAQALVAS
jgi:ribonuclease P protein component